LDKKKLRPVIIREKGKHLKGYFHRYVYQSYDYYSFTRVLVELENGRLKYFDPEFIQFTDRLHGEKNKKDDKNNPFPGL